MMLTLMKILIEYFFLFSPLLYSMHEPIIPRGARQGPSQLKRTCSIFAYEDIKEVHKRRYLLQVVSLFFFFNCGKQFLIFGHWELPSNALQVEEATTNRNLYILYIRSMNAFVRKSNLTKVSYL